MLTLFFAFNSVFFNYDQSQLKIIHNFSFSVYKGEKIVIKGNSGTGKTTLFRLLLGFEKPDEGKILFEGEPLDPSTIKKLRRQTAWLPQDLNLGNGSLREVFYYPFEFEINTQQKPDEDTVMDVLQSLGLPETVWHTNFGDLSTGQRQRVGIALCHLLDKPLILLDEPTSALDEHSKERVADLLFEQKERTILSTSHDPWWIERCDKVVELL